MTTIYRLALILKKTITFAMGNVVSRIAFVSVSLVAAQLCGQEEYAILVLLIATFNMVNGSLGFAIFTTTSKSTATLVFQKTEKDKEDFTSWLLTALALAISVSVICYQFSELFFGKLFGIYSSGYGVLAFFTFLSLANFFLMGLALGQDKSGQLSKNEFLSGTLLIVMLTVVYFFGDSWVSDHGHHIFLYMLCFFFALSVLINVYSFKNSDAIRIIKLDGKLKLAPYNHLKKSAIPAFLANLAVTLTNWLILLLLAQSQGAQQAGKFATALMIINIALYVPQLVSNIVLPKLVQAKEKQEKLNFLKSSAYIGVSFGTISWILLYLLSGIINDVYKDQFSNLSSLLLVMFIAVFPIAISKVIGQLLLSENRMKLGAKFNLLWSVFYLAIASVLLYIDVPISYIGYSFVASYIFLLSIQVVYLKRWLKSESYYCY